MRIVSTLALGLALAGAGLAQPAFAKDKKADAAAPAMKMSPNVQKALAAAQAAIKAGDLATAETQINAAKAAIATDDDKFITGQVEYQLGNTKKDEAMKNDAVDLMVASGKAPAELKPQLLLAQGQTAYNAKDFAKAQQALLAAQAAGANDPALVPMIISAMQQGGQTVQALTMLNQQIDKTAAAGQPVPSEWYQRGFTIGYNAKPTAPDFDAIRAQTSEITRKWVAAYPTKSNWHDASIIYISQYKVPTDVQVDVFRLLRAAGALTGEADYREYAEDVYLRYPNEALSVLQDGASKGVVNLSGKSNSTEILGVVKGKVAADKASLAGSEKAARTAADGKTALATADAYASYAMYPQALELYKLALSKGGIDASTVHLHSGWVMAQSGDAAGAKAEFGQVTGIRKPLADLWLVHLDHPTQG